MAKLRFIGQPRPMVHPNPPNYYNSRILYGLNYGQSMEQHGRGQLGGEWGKSHSQMAWTLKKMDLLDPCPREAFLTNAQKCK